MSNKVFVGSLPFKTTDEELAAHFASVGTVVSAKIVLDKMNNNRSKGFGFVEFSSDAEAQAAVEKLNNSELDGRTIFVDIAQPRPEKRDGGFNRKA